MGPYLLQLLVLVALVTSLLLNAVLAFRFLWRRPSPKRTLAVRIAVSGFAAVYALLALEVGCFLFVDSSDSFGFTLAARRWFGRHWHPINSLGIRDVEHDPEALAGKRVVFAAGDSFVAGHGIADAKDRFADVLAERLGPEYEVVILAKSGWHTADEYAALASYPAAPETVILSYYFNDIENAVAAHGIELPLRFDPPPAWLEPLVERSHLLNLLYWRLYRFANAAEIDRAFWEFFQEIWRRPEVWATHQEELLRIVRWAQEKEIRLIAVVFPHLREIERSRPYTARVVGFLEQHGVEVLDLARHLEGRDPDTLIVGPLDNHPSVALHHEVGELLLEKIR